MKTIKLFNKNMTIQFGTYPNGTLAFDIMHKGEPFLCATVNWEANWEGNNEYSKAFPFPAVVIKNYSENEGMITELFNAGIIEKGGAYLSGTNGTVEARILTEAWQAIAKEQLDAAKEPARLLNKDQQIEWVKAFIELWEATAPHSGNNFADMGNILDGLSQVFSDFCDKHSLPQMSADELILEMQAEDTKVFNMEVYIKLWGIDQAKIDFPEYFDQKKCFIGQLRRSYVIVSYNNAAGKFQMWANEFFKEVDHAKKFIADNDLQITTDNITKWRKDGIDLYPNIEGWLSCKINSDQAQEAGVEVIEENDKPVHALVSNRGYWVVLHKSGMFSTVAMRESEYGTLEACKKLIEEELGENVVSDNSILARRIKVNDEVVTTIREFYEDNTDPIDGCYIPDTDVYKINEMNIGEKLELGGGASGTYTIERLTDEA